MITGNTIGNLIVLRTITTYIIYIKRPEFKLLLFSLTVIRIIVTVRYYVKLDDCVIHYYYYFYYYTQQSTLQTQSILNDAVDTGRFLF